MRKIFLPGRYCPQDPNDDHLDGQGQMNHSRRPLGDGQSDHESTDHENTDQRIHHEPGTKRTFAVSNYC